MFTAAYLQFSPGLCCSPFSVGLSTKRSWVGFPVKGLQVQSQPIMARMGGSGSISLSYICVCVSPSPPHSLKINEKKNEEKILGRGLKNNNKMAIINI